MRWDKILVFCLLNGHVKIAYLSYLSQSDSYQSRGHNCDLIKLNLTSNNNYNDDDDINNSTTTNNNCVRGAPGSVAYQLHGQ